MPTFCFVDLPGRWNSAPHLDAILRASNPHQSSARTVVFRFKRGCKLLLSAALPLLSLVNQIARDRRSVILQFEDGQGGLMSYLDRMGAFALLDPNVQVQPTPPAVSAAQLYRGGNRGLVEIRPLHPHCTKADRGIPNQLAEALGAATSLRPDSRSLVNVAYMLFGELISNVYQHSETPLDGFAALQVYRNGNAAQVAVSDSGLGIIHTIRSGTLAAELTRIPDTELICEIFRRGISRLGADRGAGLHQCARCALKFGATLNVRLPRCSVRLEPSPDGYKPNVAYCGENLPLLHGTHIQFEFRLDR